jgi:hypothetical protein
VWFRRGAEHATWKDHHDKAVKYAESVMVKSLVITDTFTKVGTFTVPKNRSVGSPYLDYTLRAYVNKFIRHYERENYTMVSRPIIRRVPVIAEDEIRPIGIHESNPLNMSDRDLYEISARFKRRPVAGKLMLPDHMAEALPQGTRIT